jgi:phosphohistidine phosphatase
MKSLLLIRHAKSSWASEFSNDFDRPLSDRGKKEAPEMANRLIKNKIQIDCFVSSPAARAKKTAKHFIKEFDRDESEIIFVPALYHAGIEVFENVISELNDKHKTAAIFSHNPGITQFANMLTEIRIDNMPTCSIFAVKADINTWSEFADAEKQFLFFNYPKLETDN